MVNNPDVLKSGMNPLIHYALFGCREGRKTFRPQRKMLYEPNILIIAWIDEYDEQAIRNGIESIQNQEYENWQLLILYDKNPEMFSNPAEYCLKLDRERIKLVNKGIHDLDGILYDAALKSESEWVAYVNLCDELTPNALIEVVRLLNQSSDMDLIYTNEDHITQEGRFIEPFFKPDWSLELFRKMDYISRFFLIRRDIAFQAGLFTGSFEDFEQRKLLLKLFEKSVKISHIDKILFHRRHFNENSGLNDNSRLNEEWSKFLALHFERMDSKAVAQRREQDSLVNISPTSKENHPLTSIIIYSRNGITLTSEWMSQLSQCASNYTRYETIVVGSNHQCEFENKDMEQLPVIVKNSNNLAFLLNESSRVSKGDFLFFLNVDDQPVETINFQKFLFYAKQADTGAVGSQIGRPVLYKNIFKTRKGDNSNIGFPLVHALDRPVYHFYKKYYGSLCALSSIEREVTSVSKSSMLIKREFFLNAGGFDDSYQTEYFDVDFCFKLRERGFKNILISPLKADYLDKISYTEEKNDPDLILFLDKWQDLIESFEPFSYNSLVPIRTSPLSRLTIH